MTKDNFVRQLPFESVFNFRDLGGYAVGDGRSVRAGTLYRSGELQHVSPDDLSYIRNDLGVSNVIDLRSPQELERRGIVPTNGTDIRHHNVPFSGSREESQNRLRSVSNMGELYLSLMGHPRFPKALTRALELIASSDNQPLVFHCTAGKDRTGILSALILGLLGVPPSDIAEDYALSGPPTQRLRERINVDPKRMARTSYSPEFAWGAVPESIELVLTTITCDHGSVADYAQAQGVSRETISLLRMNLLE